MPKLSIIVPIHDMENGDRFLWRSMNMLAYQTFQDFEIIITKEGRMAENTNTGIKRARGEFIKILYLDDYLAGIDSLQKIVDSFGKDDMWLATGCWHDAGDGKYRDAHVPTWNDEMSTGKNTIGSPSVITLRNEGRLLFDENLSWLLDADLYTRYYHKYGKPKLINDLNVVIGVGAHQMTHKLTDEEKLSEHEYINKKNA